MVSTFQLLEGVKMGLADSLEVTAIGVATVFAVLVLLIVLIEALHALLKDKKAPVKQEASVSQKVEKRISAGVMAEAPEADIAGDDPEFIAAVSAAITCVTGNANFKIKSIKKG